MGIFGVVICDEAHKIETDTSKTYASIAQLAPDKFIEMTGTPMLNKPLDLYTLLKAIEWRARYTHSDLCYTHLFSGSSCPYCEFYRTDRSCVLNIDSLFVDHQLFKKIS